MSRSAVAGLLCAVALVLAGNAPADAIGPLGRGSFVFDAEIERIVRADDGHIYVAGWFTEELAPTGGGLVLPAGGTGQPDAPSFAHVAGTVTAVAADGHGGWYIGGCGDREA